MKVIFIVLALVALLVVVYCLKYREWFDPSIPPILIISIPGSPRREHMKNLLKNYKGQIKFLDGIVVKDEKTKLNHLHALDIPREKVNLVKGELGCALAHIYAYKYIVDHHIKRAVILEDDVVFNEDENKVLHELATYAPKNPEPPIMWLHDKHGFGFQAQIISLEGARSLLKNRADLLSEPIDEVVWKKKVPVDWVRGPAYFKHQFEFDDVNTSERIQLDRQP